MQKVDEAEVDEMWSFVGHKKAPRWLWHAIDHCTGSVLAGSAMLVMLCVKRVAEQP
jgi:hypothetical protein